MYVKYFSMTIAAKGLINKKKKTFYDKYKNVNIYFTLINNSNINHRIKNCNIIMFNYFSIPFPMFLKHLNCS